LLVSYFILKLGTGKPMGVQRETCAPSMELRLPTHQTMLKTHMSTEQYDVFGT